MRILFTLMAAMAVAAAQQNAQPMGEVHGPDAIVRGAVTVSPTATLVLSGSQVSAGASPAIIKLTRGGELKVCAGSSITMTASASGREALFGLNQGTLETRYRLSSSADTVVTPDFRLQLPGPGDFHFAIGMRNSGDMCVKSLPGNSSSMIVHEVFGDGSHQVRAGEAVVFQKGSVQNSVALPTTEECGCANAIAANPVASKPVAAKPVELGFPEQQSQRAAAAIAAGEPPPETSALPGVSNDKNEVLTKVDAPIVFRGEELGKPAPPVPGEPAVPAVEPNAERKVEAKTPEVPADKPKPVKKRWYQKLGSALANIFR
jgi:hypothetical protein